MKIEKIIQQEIDKLIAEGKVVDTGLKGPDGLPLYEVAPVFMVVTRQELELLIDTLARAHDVSEFDRTKDGHDYRKKVEDLMNKLIECR